MTLVQDLRYAVRILARDRWFTAIAALALAVGIGVNNTVFTLVNAVLIRGVPFENAEQVMALSARDAQGRDRPVSYLDYQDWRETARAFSGLAAYVGGTMNVSEEGKTPERFQGSYIASHLFRLVGEKPALGRDFLPDDDRPGAAAVVILSDRVWRTRYNGDPNVLNRTIRVNDIPSVIIGVMAEGFQFPNNAETWQPLVMQTSSNTKKRDARTSLNVLGRLNDGVTLAQARSEMDTITGRLAQTYPDTNKDFRASIVSFNERVAGGPIRLMFLSLMGAVAFVLLIACANVANLLLARSAHRAREISVRISLGASRWRIVRQLLVESVLLAVVSGLLGLGLSVVGVRLFDAATADPALGRPYWIDFAQMDWRVFTFFAAVCLVTGIAFGLAPALHVSKTNVNEVLKEGGRSGGVGVRARRWTSALLVVELALTLVLLAGAGFMMRSFLAMYRFDLGVNTSNLTTMRLVLPDQKYPSPEQRMAFFDRLEERLSAIRTIPSVTITSNPPMTGGALLQLAVEGKPTTPGTPPPTALVVRIGAAYFETLGLQPLRGRVFTNLDGTPGRESAIVNQYFAATHFPNEDPIGRRIRLTVEGAPGEPPAWATIVGVAPMVRQRNLQNTEPDSIVYLPYRSDPVPFATLIARTAGDPTAVTALLREEVRALDANLPLFNITTLDRQLANQRWPYRIFGSMFALFAIIALLLSALGLYAVTSYSVTQRTQEIGIRMALGAQPSQVWWLFFRTTLVQLGIGLTVGLTGAFGVGQLLQTMLVQTGSRDPATLVSIALVLTAVSLAACSWPARRATRLDPLVALRYE